VAIDLALDAGENRAVPALLAAVAGRRLVPVVRAAVRAAVQAAAVADPGSARVVLAAVRVAAVVLVAVAAAVPLEPVALAVVAVLGLARVVPAVGLLGVGGPVVRARLFVVVRVEGRVPLVVPARSATQRVGRSVKGSAGAATARFRGAYRNSQRYATGWVARTSNPLLPAISNTVPAG
jgi:hypothetical protein